MIWIIVSLILTVVDGLLTLVLLARGASEVNPVMVLALGLGPVVFLASKVLLTGGFMGVLRVLRPRLLVVVPCAYLFLIGYQVVLLTCT